jgi:hypothetical protein
MIFGLKENRFMICSFMILSQLPQVFMKVDMNTVSLGATLSL